MSIGLWSVPMVVVGLVAILWVATWLERLVAPPAFDVELVMPETVAERLTAAITPAAFPSIDAQAGVELGSAAI
jgi:hypothetical protein